MCNRIVQLVVLRIIPRGTLSLLISESQFAFATGPPLNEFSALDKNAVQENVFDARASGVHSARLQQVSSTAIICFDWTVSNLHSG